MKLSAKLKAHLLHLGIESVNVQANRVQGYILKDGIKYCTLTNREVELIIRTWNCCTGELLTHECSDEAAEAIAKTANVCGGIALDVYNATLAQIKKEVS